MTFTNDPNDTINIIMKTLSNVEDKKGFLASSVRAFKESIEGKHIGTKVNVKL